MSDFVLPTLPFISIFSRRLGGGLCGAEARLGSSLSSLTASSWMSSCLECDAPDSESILLNHYFKEGENGNEKHVNDVESEDTTTAFVLTEIKVSTS